MSILTKLGNLHFYLKWKDILPKKLSSNFCYSLAYPKKNMSLVTLSTLTEFCFIKLNRDS